MRCCETIHSMKPLVILKNLGKMDFKSALEIQLSLVRRHLNSLESPGTCPSQILDTLLIVEHPPTYTVGIRTANYSEETEAKLKKLGAEFHQTNRGGLITFHGPGQLVAYPILNLNHFKKSVKWYIKCLESTLITTCDSFGVAATTCEHTGVWVKGNKIAAIGIHARRFVTNHGISLNCNIDLGWFGHIVPCGISDRGVTSLTEQLQQDTTVAATLVSFQEAFQNHFHCELINDDVALS